MYLYINYYVCIYIYVYKLFNTAVLKIVNKINLYF